MKVILLNPPRLYWPYLSEYDNFILPQALPCLAAVLRENDIDVKPIDCLPLKIGWKSLEKKIEKEKPDVVGICTSETMFSFECIKAAEMVKRVDKEIVTVTGGAHFSNLTHESLENDALDFIAIGEGEYTLLELVKEIEKTNPRFKNVKGIAFKKDGEVIETQPRPLIENLDDLPLPAYDLMPMSKYGKGKFLFTPGGTTIHHSRGCVHNCKFCAYWVQMAERKIENGKLVLHPKWRTKSVERVMEEVEVLHKKYKKDYLEFIDDTWNTNPKWNEQFADALLERDYDLNWFGFMRADYIIRDEKLGIFKKLVDSGLIHTCIGIERAVDSSLDNLGKSNYSSSATEKCFHLLKKKYPQVFRQGTFIVGLRNETRKSMWELFEYAKKLDLDFPSFHPLTPVPGTAYWDEARKEGWIEVEDFRQYDWLTPIMKSDHLSREEIVDIIYEMNKKYVRLKWLLKGLTSRRKYKRDMYVWWLLVSFKIFLDVMKNRFKSSEKSDFENEFRSLVKPKWYDS
jgi:anaerobic magnesium-protoporphyrin IX monomethyl ester cyclase